MTTTTLPVLEKTWTISGNNVLTGSGNVVTDRKALFLALKNSMCNAPIPWTVSASCNATQSMVGSDILQSISSIINAADGTGHSWIVLQQSEISDAFQICFDFSSTTQSSMTIVVSPVSGFSGSSTTRRPTAPDEYLVLSNSSWFDFSNHASSKDIIYNTWFSSDGLCNRIVVLWDLNSRGMWLFDQPSNVNNLWREKSMFFTLNGRGQPLSSSLLFESPVVGCRVNDKSGQAFFMAEGTRDGTIYKTFAGLNPFTGKYPLLPMTVYSWILGRCGVLGEVSDMWYGPHLNTLMTGTTYPESGSAQFVQFGNLVFPWTAGRQVRIG